MKILQLHQVEENHSYDIVDQNYLKYCIRMVQFIFFYQNANSISQCNAAFECLNVCVQVLVCDCIDCQQEMNLNKNEMDCERQDR